MKRSWRARLRLWRSPTAVYLASAVLARVGAFLLVPLYTRDLAVDEYGDYIIFLTAVSLSSTLCSLGLAAAVPRYYFKEPDASRGRRAAAAVARLHACITLCVVGVVGACVFVWSADGTELWHRRSLLLAAVSTAGMALAAVPVALAKAEKRVFLASGFQLLQFVATTGAGLLLVGAWGRGYGGALEAIALAYGLLGVVSLGYVIRLPAGTSMGSIGRAAIRFSVPFIPHFAAQWALAAGDRWLLKIHGFGTELGQFALAGQLVSPTHIVLSAWNDTAHADMGETFRREGIRGLAVALPRLRLTYLATLVLPGLLTILCLPLADWLIGDAFDDAFSYVPLMLLVLLPNALYHADFHVVFYSGRSTAVGLATTAAAVVNLGANVLLIPSLGAWGAVIAQFLGFGCRASVLLLVSLRVRRSAREA